MSYWLGLILYLPMALFALWRSWGLRGARVLGIALVVSCAVSNIIDFTLDDYWFPVLFPILDVIVGLAAITAWKVSKSRVPLAVLVLAILSALANIALSVEINPSDGQVYAYKVILNIIFSMQCITLATWGFYHAHSRSDRVRRGGRGARVSAQSHRNSSDEPG